MKILFITNIPTPYRVDFFNELGKHSELTVLYERLDAKNRNSNWLKTDSKYYRAEVLKGLKFRDDSVISIGSIKWLKKNKFDYIVIGGYSTPVGIISLLYLKIKRIPFILNIDGGLIKEDSKLMYFIKKRLIGSATYWLSPSKNASDYLVHYGAQKNKILEYPFTSIRESDIHTHISSRNTLKSDLRNKLNFSEEKTVLFVGQIIHRKGIDLIIEAASELRDVGFYLIGGLPSNEYMDTIKKRNLTNIKFLGFKNKAEMREYYLASDIFLLPTREDIWGLVINEAMAEGLPIITTNKCVSGLELIENGENGYIVESENISQIVNSIKKLVNDDELLIKIGENNLEKIKKYTIESMVSRHMDIFKDIKC